jgi:Ca2+-transporting ATPase
VIDTSDPQNPTMVGADRTEQAMLRFVLPTLATPEEIDLVEVIPFNSSRKFSASQVVHSHETLTLVKGASEVVLENCSHYLDADGNKIALTDQESLLEKNAQFIQSCYALTGSRDHG